MNNKGFVFVETIVAVVVLTSSLLLLYSTFHSLLQSEKTRVYYDDINYIYRSYYLKNKIKDLNIMSVIKDINSDENKYFTTIGIEYDELFDGYVDEKNYLNSLINDFDIKQMIILKESKLDDLKSCNLKNYNESEACNNLYMNLSEEMINYLKSIYVDVSCTYILVSEYVTCSKDDTNCHNYYSWVSV